MTAFVLGNGVSRRPIDVNQLAKLAPIYGCNALYRTHTPDVLVATDQPISTVIQESGYSAKNRFYTRKPIPGLGAYSIPKQYYGFSSGPIAVAIAAEDNHLKIYLLGFDMGPNSNGRFNNVYASTEFYKNADALPTYTGNWANQLVTIMQQNTERQFIRVCGDTTADIEKFKTVKNFQSLPFADFVSRINTPKDL